MTTQPAAHAGSAGAHPTAGHGPVTALRSQPRPAAPPGHPRILVVEPDDDLRLTLVFTLAVEGWEVVEADCMAAANWAVRERRPTVVLTELVLGGQESTGLLLLTALRGYDPNLPIIALTALMVTPERRRRTVAAGAREVLTKPFDRDDLVALIGACHRDYIRVAYIADRDADGQADAGSVTGPDWVAVGRVIGERRRALGLPKNEAARQAKVSNTTWRLLEAGRSNNPTEATIVRVAKVIGVEPDALLHTGSHTLPCQGGRFPAPTASEATASEVVEAAGPKMADADPAGGASDGATE